MKAFTIVFFFILFQQVSAQVIPAGFPVLEELVRRKQILGDLEEDYSFVLRPSLKDPKIYGATAYFPVPIHKSIELGLLPVVQTTRFSTKRPYGWADYGMIPTPGLQGYFSGGFYSRWKGLELTFRPELVIAQNKRFNGFKGMGDRFLDAARFLYWITADNPERFGTSSYTKFSLGQSSLSYSYGAFQVSLGTENIWWGPGQFNALTFSNNAQGFPHLSIRTRRPAKTFLGKVEVQLMSGRLESERYSPSQSDSLNSLYFRPYRDKWKYVNGLILSWNPKWVKGLHVGGIRTVQTFGDSLGKGFIDILPVFWGVTKKSVGSDLIGESDRGRSQQIVVFGRYAIERAKAEIYFEFGRRDHAYNWRDFALSPEHARAYILGFNKLFSLKSDGSHLLVRGEMTHQQESINRYIRYLGLRGGFSWHMNGSVGGFTNSGQLLGVGIGTGSNVQTLEISKVNGVRKTGIVFERLATLNDYYYKVQFQNTQRKPWIDYSMGFLYDRQFGSLLLSSKLQVIHARNYQWQLDPLSTPEFPRGRNLTSVLAQVSAVYFWNKGEDGILGLSKLKRNQIKE